MLRQQNSKSKRKPKRRFRGIVSAAKALKRDRTHLWRCLVGQRSSPALLQRFTDHQTVSKNPVIAVPIELAAAENLSPFLFNTLSTLGLEVVVVRFKAGQGSPIWDHPGIERNLERELQSAGAGQFDSEFYTNDAWWLFYHVSDLAKAMQLLKTSLEARGLLGITTILHAESAHELRVWYPATAELVNAPAEPET